MRQWLEPWLVGILLASSLAVVGALTDSTWAEWIALALFVSGIGELGYLTLSGRRK